MTRDEEIRQGLHAAGVPDYAMWTTLALEKESVLHSMVSERALIREGAPSRGVFMFPSPRASSTKARKLFYLVGKELFLTGKTVCCLTLTKLADVLRGEDFGWDAPPIDRVRMVMLLDFYEHGAGFPLETADAARLRAWIRNKFEAGGAVSCLSDSPVERCSAWWPSSFLGFVTENSIIHTV